MPGVGSGLLPLAALAAGVGAGGSVGSCSGSLLPAAVAAALKRRLHPSLPVALSQRGNNLLCGGLPPRVGGAAW